MFKLAIDNCVVRKCFISIKTGCIKYLKIKKNCKSEKKTDYKFKSPIVKNGCKQLNSNVSFIFS